MSWTARFALRSVMPPGGDVALKGLDDETLRPFLKQFYREAPLLMRVGLEAGSLMLVAGPVITLGLPVPAFVLPARLRDKHVYKLATHRSYYVRQATLVLKMVAGLCWGQDPDVRSDLGVGELGPDPGTWKEDA